MDGVTVHDQVHLLVEVADEPLQEAAQTPASNRPVKTMKCIRPLVLIADIAFTENGLTLRRTIGVRSFSP